MDAMTSNKQFHLQNERDIGKAVSVGHVIIIKN